jgi:uncharacterized protein (DUF1697 family)
MQTYIGLLRAINVGGTGKLAMADLKAQCAAAGFASVRTYIASGNVVFKSSQDEAAVKAALETRLAAHAGKPIGVVVRKAADFLEVLHGNPFADAPGSQVVAIFFDQIMTRAALDGVAGQADNERLSLGKREIYVLYGSGIGASKLRIPAATAGTARNMNTVAKLAAMALA